MSTDELSEWLYNGTLPASADQRFACKGGWFCGCGDPEAAAGRLLGLLDTHPLHEDYDARVAARKVMLPDEGVEYLVLYTLDHFGLTEHGGSVGGAWLTPLGEEVRDALRRERQEDEFETLFNR